MAFDKVIDSAKLDAGMTATAEAIRAKTGQADPIAWEAEKGFSDAVAGIETGGDNTMFVSLLDGTATEIVLPDGLVNLKTILNKNTSATSVTFPETLETIGDGVFAYVSGIASDLVFPKNLKSIGNNAFNSCFKVKTVTFHGTPESLHTGAFNGCYGAKTVNVPWAEGEVANAPWGFSNATINYNYTGG